jgi:hypothetical protein
MLRLFVAISATVLVAVAPASGQEVYPNRTMS